MYIVDSGRGGADAQTYGLYSITHINLFPTKREKWIIVYWYNILPTKIKSIQKEKSELDID